MRKALPDQFPRDRRPQVCVLGLVGNDDGDSVGEFSYIVDGVWAIGFFQSEVGVRPRSRFEALLKGGALDPKTSCRI